MLRLLQLYNFWLYQWMIERQLLLSGEANSSVCWLLREFYFFEKQGKKCLLSLGRTSHILYKPILWKSHTPLHLSRAIEKCSQLKQPLYRIKASSKWMGCILLSACNLLRALIPLRKNLALWEEPTGKCGIHNTHNVFLRKKAVEWMRAARILSARTQRAWQSLHFLWCTKYFIASNTLICTHATTELTWLSRFSYERDHMHPCTH